VYIWVYIWDVVPPRRWSMFVIGFTVEAVADSEKFNFKNDTRNNGPLDSRPSFADAFL
jgi:steroid 5-alpha reductase family enzyme